MLNEVTPSEEEVVTVRVWPGSIVRILEPAVRRRRLAGGRGSGITVFAPADDMVMNRIGDFGEYPSFFRRHVVPCRLLWNDLVDFGDGSELPTFLEGFAINITRSDGVLILNGVRVFFPDVFFNDRVVVHGVSDVLAAQDNALRIDVDDEEILFDPSEF